MSKLAKRLLNHERNKHIVYDEEPHTYTYFPSGDKRKTTEAVEFDGITSWIKKYCSTFNADKVLDKHYDNWQRTKDERYYGLSREEIKQQWNKKGNESRIEGSNIHKAIENVINYDGLYDEEYGNYIDVFFDVMDKHGIEPVRAEFVVYDEDIKRSTPIDIVGIRDNKIVPLDIKTFEDGMEFIPYKGRRMKHPLGGIYESKFEKVSLQVGIARRWLIDKYGFDQSEVEKGGVILMNENVGAQLYSVLDRQDHVQRMYNYE